MIDSGFDLPSSLDYIVPERATAVESREFDYDIRVKPLEPRLMRTVWRIVRRREAAEDALQEALTIIWKKRDAIARHPNPQALILRIAVSAAVDALRKDRRRLRHEVPGRPDVLAEDDQPSSTKKGEDKELREVILEAIRRLPRRQATATLLHIIEELPYQEVARAMGCSEATARVHVSRGRAKLVRLLARERPDLIRRFDRAGEESR